MSKSKNFVEITAGEGERLTFWTEDQDIMSYRSFRQAAVGVDAAKQVRRITEEEDVKLRKLQEEKLADRPKAEETVLAEEVETPKQKKK